MLGDGNRRYIKFASITNHGSHALEMQQLGVHIVQKPIPSRHDRVLLSGDGHISGRNGSNSSDPSISVTPSRQCLQNSDTIVKGLANSLLAHEVYSYYSVTLIVCPRVVRSGFLKAPIILRSPLINAENALRAQSLGMVRRQSGNMGSKKARDSRGQSRN